VACDGDGLPVFDRLRYRRDARRVFLYAFDAIQDHELDRPRQCASLLVVGQLNDLTAVDTEDHLLPTRQLDDEFQLLAGLMR
jgi:hypothetical protein